MLQLKLQTFKVKKKIKKKIQILMFHLIVVVQACFLFNLVTLLVKYDTNIN